MTDSMRPTFKWEINITTILAIMMFFITLGTMFANQATFTDRVNRWITAHEEMHKVRQSEVTGITARLDERIKTLESGAANITNLVYRITVLEQGNVNLGVTVEEVKRGMNQLASDVRVIREILTRTDPGTPSRR